MYVAMIIYTHCSTCISVLIHKDNYIVGQILTLQCSWFGGWGVYRFCLSACIVFGCSKNHSELAFCEFCLHGIDFEITGSCQMTSDLLFLKTEKCIV